ncbi:TPA_asm: N [Zea alphacytorhabdovirus 1]|nr:TPA_asm: N [Zea alphacytorhabdovirus 1]
MDKRKVKEALAALRKGRNVNSDGPSNDPPVMQQTPSGSNTNKPPPNADTRPPAYTNNKYQDINHVTISVARSASVWSDDQFKSIKIFDVEQLNADDSVLFGQALTKAIESGDITSDIIFMMLHLAVSCRSTLDIDDYLLTKPPGMVNSISHAKPAVEESESFQQADDVDNIDTIFAAAGAAPASGEPKTSKKKRKKNTKFRTYVEKNAAEARSSGTSQGTSLADKKYMAAAYSYIAAYLMRLQCRMPDERMIESIEKARTRYSGFYDSGRTVLDNMDFSVESLKEIRDVIARKPEVTSTWVAWVAYNENETELVKQDFGLMEYLATQVFAYQGMHVVTQTLAIHQMTAVPIGYLLREMDCQMTRAAVTEIYNIVKHYHKNDEHPDRKTYYRYSRVWNEGYFSKVQSKSCAQLLYLAAKIVKDIGNNTNSDPTKIFAIKDLSESAKERLNQVANNIIRYIWAQADDDEEAGNAWKNLQ